MKLTWNQVRLLIDWLRTNTNMSELTIGLQCGFLMMGHRGSELHDDTCHAITALDLS